MGDGRMLSRRRFIAQASLAAGSALLGDALVAGGASAAEPGAPGDPKLLERARALLERAPLIDGHNDLAAMFLEVRADDLSQLDMGKVQPTLCADIPRLREGRVGAQYWSIWVDSSTQNSHTALHDALRQFDVMLRFIASRPELAQARTADDLERIHRSGKIASLFGVEGGHMIESSPAALRIFQELGARYITLTHFDDVPWADSATDRPELHGLSEFGKKIVRELNRIGVFADISHVSAETMLDVLHVTRAPVIFSHSNARALNPHVRNVPDEVLRLMPANGGVVHVNFIREFVSPGDPAWQAKRTAALRDLHLRFDTDAEIRQHLAQWEKDNPHPRGTIADVADHIDHIRQVAGIDYIGIGSDFYDASGSSMAIGLEDVTRYPYLFAELLRRGYTDDDVLKIAGRNHLRAMRRMEAVAEELQKSEQPLVIEGPTQRHGYL
jgi:membrane dipeptidase